MQYCLTRNPFGCNKNTFGSVYIKFNLKRKSLIFCYHFNGSHDSNLLIAQCLESPSFDTKLEGMCHALHSYVVCLLDPCHILEACLSPVWKIYTCCEVLNIQEVSLGRPTQHLSTLRQRVKLQKVLIHTRYCVKKLSGCEQS